MVKAYTSKDIDFSGDNTFSGDVDVNDDQVTNVDTPTADGDGANKKYVDEQSIGISTSNTNTGEGDYDTIDNIVSTSVTVASGQKVLLLASGNTRLNPDDEEEFTEIWFRRGSTDLNHGSYNPYMADLEGDEQHQSFFMHYLDTTPGTGTITYYLRGITDDEYINGRFTALVMN